MIILFTGPSLPPSEVPSLPDLWVLPPAAQGDVYRAARERPWGIGIIDGFFEHVPAVWHKEILWAMSEGIHVFGASSMGALRAAELADFGMVGVGRIFEQLRDGTLTGDDEVAVAHLAAEHGYRRVSEALVDIRATLAAAVEAGICEPALAERLITLARDQFYAERTWPTVITAAHAACAGDNDPAIREALAALERWLPRGRVDQKRRDALALIEIMQATRTEHPAALQVSFTFQHTNFWEHSLARTREQPLDIASDPDAAALLDELRLLGDEQLYTLAVQGALLRGLAEQATERHGLKLGLELVQRTAREFRRTHGLYTGPATSAWLTEQNLDPKSFFQLMTRQARLRWTQTVYEPEARHHLADQLRAMSCHGQLHVKARAKHAALEREGLAAADLATTGESDEALRWYFHDRLGKPVPDDLAVYAERFGFSDAGALVRAVRLEHWYATRRTGEPSTSSRQRRQNPPTWLRRTPSEIKRR